VEGDTSNVNNTTSIQDDGVNFAAPGGTVNDCDESTIINGGSSTFKAKDPREQLDSDMLAKVTPRPVRPVAKISMDKSGHIRKVVITAEYKVA
ncbi:MAG: hypothetical protein AB7S81_01040, partial [Bdellovibrionales bacterium]